MKSVLTVTADEGLINRIKLILNEDDVSYFYALSAEDGSNIASNNEIAVAIIDYKLPIISGKELCEMLLSINPEIQVMLIFDQSDTREVISVYNEYHLSKLLCKEYLVLEDLPVLVESCLHIYNREEELEKLDSELQMFNSKYLKPMQEMSSVLNERLRGYGYVIDIFKSSSDFVLKLNDGSLNAINDFVNNIFNDYINIFMVKEPDLDIYFDRIRNTFNKPSEKKFFRFEKNDFSVDSEKKYSLLFLLNVLTNYFDVFYSHYRGKLSVIENNSVFEINSIYEIRRNSDIEGLYNYISNCLGNILLTYSDDVKVGTKDNIIQYRVRIV